MPNFPAIPDPTTDTASLRDAVMALKQCVELITGQRGTDNTSALTRDGFNLGGLGVSGLMQQVNTRGTAAEVLEVLGVAPGDYLQKTANLDDVASKSAARSNLGVAYGKQSIFVPAAALTAAALTPATKTSLTGSTSGVTRPAFEFAKSGFQAANFTISMPKSWDGGALSAVIYWEHLSASTNFNVLWQLLAVAVSASSSLDPSITGTGAGTVVAVGGATTTLYKSPGFSLTPEGTISTDAYLMFRIGRVPTHASDTLNATARLLGVRIRYNTNANNDT